jgi:RNA polymerase sigma factor (sigma-70 family)
LTNDTTLLERARGGDPVALDALMRERRTQVVRYAMRLCVSREDAEDATQETLIALSRSVGALREVAALSRWLFLAVRTHCMRLARRSVRHAMSLEEGEIALEGDTPEEKLVDNQLRQRLSVILAELDPATCEVIVRCDVLGESAAEASAALGISVAALKSRLHRAREDVKSRLLASMKPRPRSISRILRPFRGSRHA